MDLSMSLTRSSMTLEAIEEERRVAFVVAGVNGQGARDHAVYVSDRNNNRLMTWMKDAKEGIAVVGG
jgi:hypothetical protein